MGIYGRNPAVIYLSLIQIRVERSVRKRDRYGTDRLACWLRDGVLVKTGAATPSTGGFPDGLQASARSRRRSGSQKKRLGRLLLGTVAPVPVAVNGHSTVGSKNSQEIRL